MKKVVAVDRDPFMVEWCQHHYPDVIPGTGELMDIAASGVLPYNTAHIDMCGGIRKADNILTVARVAQGVSTHPAVIAVTMLKGREGVAHRGLMGGVHRATRRRLLKDARKKGDVLAEHVYSGKPFDSNEMRKVMHEEMKEAVGRHPSMGMGIMKKSGKLTALGMGVLRGIILHHTVEYLWEAWGDQGSNLPPGEKLHMQQVGVIVYHSGTKKGGGTPFATVLYLVYRTSQMTSVGQWLQAVGMDDASLAAAHIDGGVCPYDTITLQDALERFNPTIAAMARVQDHKKVARMFGIDPKSIPAIIAHDTRGSYGDPLWKSSKVALPEEIHNLGWGGQVEDLSAEEHKRKQHRMIDQIEVWLQAGNDIKDFVFRPLKVST
jgi:hypothetical protein